MHGFRTESRPITMKKSRFALPVWGFVALSIIFSMATSSVAGEANRSVEGSATSPTVTIHADPQGTASAWAVEESVPTGLSPSNIGGDGVHDTANGKVKWGLFLDSVSRDLTYSVSGSDGSHSVTGTAGFDGTNVDVTGESTITVGCEVPTIEYFRADPNAIDPGGTATLSWSISNANSARIDNGIGDVDPVQGSIAVSPRETTTYTLTASNACGPDIRLTTVRVTGGAADKAVIVVGSQAENDALLPAFRNCGDRAFDTLLKRGFSSSTIYYLDPPSKEGESPKEYRDGDSTLANVNYALTEWAVGARDVIVYLVDHGAVGKLFLSPTEVLHAYQLKPWLDQLGETISGTVVVVVEACHAGSFIEGLAPNTGSPRIVVACTQPEDDAVLLREGNTSFSQEFWQEIENDYDLFSALTNAAEDLRWLDLGKDEQGKPKLQIPLFDADGDGSASDGFDGNESDRTIASSHKIGTSQGTAAAVPFIREVSPATDIEGESSAILWAKIEYSGTGVIDQAWAVIVPPGFDHEADSQPVTDLELDSVQLENKGNRWEAVYPGFSRTGEYRVSFFASDDEGTVSSPQTTTITKSVPDPYVDGIYKSAGKDMNAYVQTYDNGSAVVILTPDLNKWYVFVEETWQDGISNLADYAGSGHHLTMTFREDGRIAASLAYADGSTASWTFDKDFGISDPPTGYDGIFKADDQSMNAYVQTYAAGSALVILTPDLKSWYAFLDSDYSDGISAGNDLAQKGRQFFMNFVSADRANGGLSFPSGIFHAFSMDKAYAAPQGVQAGASRLWASGDLTFGPLADPANAHPADLNTDFRMELSEVRAYEAAWKHGQPWSKAPNPVPVAYLTRAGYLYQQGGTYHYAGGSAPGCWQKGTGGTPAETVTNSLGMTFRYIPPGTFMMGSPTDEPDREDDEKQHQVTLTQVFYMQTTEVTQGQWKAVMDFNPSDFSSCGNDCPVDMVSWEEVQTFISKMNQRGEGTYRLPTEAEWEYAARAGTTTAIANGGISQLGCNYEPNLAAMGWYCNNSGDKTHPVARKTPNAWGLYDMHGNVREWCQDWYGAYSIDPVTDPSGPPTGSFRVKRGGSWGDGVGYCRSAIRNPYSPGEYGSDLGLRLVREPD